MNLNVNKLNIYDRSLHSFWNMWPCMWCMYIYIYIYMNNNIYTILELFSYGIYMDMTKPLPLPDNTFLKVLKPSWSFGLISLRVLRILAFYFFNLFPRTWWQAPTLILKPIYSWQHQHPWLCVSLTCLQMVLLVIWFLVDIL